ncbi:dihydrofolate reductase [Pseudoduganella plicata]|uniref:Dihydrofolate reductase n=1 Tax=Pseudoduganella plicata TaxID=321984 RepID=A0A4P7BB41_9BURK|nr:dihydrofolate reductase [Pseudoduganella plicata]QBQ35102.1 dihydrofolate reductase [Pseudoduganella plicata]GGZ10259.1 dihydrofolate reductase [Pseudoduganella plicata]
MTQLAIIVAVDRNNGIGVNNQLPWHLPEDLAHFKRLTTGHPIVMGRRTFDSIGRPLPNRRSIVVTRNVGWRHAGVEAVTSLADAVALVGDAPAFIIGGAQIFAEALAIADRLIVTHIDQAFDCDTFFPAIDRSVWQENERQAYDSASGLAYTIVTYIRQSPVKE